MPHYDEGYPLLPAYAARISGTHQLVMDNIDQLSRSVIVYSGLGPQKVPIHFRADGIAIFEFDKSPDFSGGAVDPFHLLETGHLPKDAQRQDAQRNAVRDKRYRYMNAMQSCFHVAVNMNIRLAPPSSFSHYIWARNVGPSWQLMDCGAGLIDALPMGSPVHKDKLIETIESFRLIELHDIEASLGTLDLFYRAAFNLNHHEFQTVLVLGWAIIESCQDVLWRRFVEGGYKKANPKSEIKGKRKALLLEDKNYTASIKSQVLGLFGEYTDYELAQIDEVRKRRNSFMHSLASVSVGDAFAAMNTCRIVASKAHNLKLQSFGHPGGWDYKR